MRRRSRESKTLKVIPCDCGKGEFVRFVKFGITHIVGKNCRTCGMKTIDEDFVAELRQQKPETPNLTLF